MQSFLANKSKLRLLGVLIVVGIILALLLLPKGEDLGRYEAMLARGEGEVCARQLAKALGRKPQWHEARELLIAAYLASDSPLLALENLLFLGKEGYDSQHTKAVQKLLVQEDNILQARELIVQVLEEDADFDDARIFLIQLETSPNNPAPNPDLALAQLAILAHKDLASATLERSVLAICTDSQRHLAYLDENFDDGEFPWVLDMKLRIILQWGDHDLLVGYLRQLKERGIELGGPSLDRVRRQERSLIHSLELALLVERQQWIDGVLTQAEQAELSPGELTVLLELLPQEPRLLVLQAFNAEDPRQGMETLAELEAAGYVPQDLQTYGESKMELIQRVGHSEAHWLDFIPDELIITHIMSSQDQLASSLVDWLEEQRSDLTWEIDILRQITASSAKVPKLLWQSPDNYWGVALSPDGKWVLVESKSESGMSFVHVATGESYPIQGSDWGSWHWSPDCKQVCFMPWNGMKGTNTLYLYSIDSEAGAKMKELELPINTWMTLGWLDSTTLLLASSEPQSEHYVAIAVDITTGKIKWQTEPRQAMPMLSQNLELTWVWQDGDELVVELGTKIRRFNLPTAHHYSPRSWSKSDKLLLLDSNGSACTLDFKSGQHSYMQLPPNFQPGNWRNGYNFWGMVNFYIEQRNSYHSALVVVNAETGGLQYAGLTFLDSISSYLAWGKYVAVTTDGGITYLYDIP